MTIQYFGHQNQILEIKNFLNNKEHGVCFVGGPEFLGKKTIISDLLSSFHKEDTHILDASLDGIRSIQSVLSTYPLSDFRRYMIYFDDYSNYTAQDAFLKILEEPPNSSKIIVVYDNGYYFNKTFLSRMRHSIRFNILNNEEMRNFASQYGDVNEIAVELSSGKPGIYYHLNYNSKILEFALKFKYKSIDVMDCFFPFKISELTPELKFVLMHILNKIFSFTKYHKLYLEFSSRVKKVPSCDFELHWKNFIISSVM